MIRLQAERLDRFLTVDQLAVEADVHPRTIYRIEEGRGARVDTLRKLSTFLNVPASDLLRGTPDHAERSAA